MAKDSSFEIRSADADDAAHILDMHHDSVHKLAKTHYPQNKLDSWSPPPTPERIHKLADKLHSGEELGFVAEHKDKIIGYGALVPDGKEVRAVYVSPEWAHQGVGKALLTQIMKKAISEFGIEQLTLSSSLNAIAFYQRHGFEIIEMRDHCMQSGDSLKSAYMRLIF